jgi:two-component system, cell cycle response regulator DivK
MRNTLLIVEDSELNSDLLVQIFEDAYEIALAWDGETAIELAATERPDLILMDIGLPGMSGLDAVRAIRAAGASTPIIAVSAGVMPGDRERAIEAGCDEFVAKPIDDSALVEMAGRLVRSR